MTGAERQARYRAKREGAGLVQVNVWLPPAAAADIQLAAERMRNNPQLSIARLVDRGTGRLVSLKVRKVRTMHRYQIINTISGVDLGIYAAADADGALDQMARGAGYADFAAACEVAPIKPGELKVTLVA